MSASARNEAEQQEGPQMATSPSQEGPKKNEYLVHTGVRTMLGNPSAMYHGKVVVVPTNIPKNLMAQRQKKKEEKRKKKEEKRRLKAERKRQWEEQQQRKKTEEEAVQRQSRQPSSPRAVSFTEGQAEGLTEEGVLPEAIYCNTCGLLSYASGLEYEYSVSSHLTAVFLTLCCYCWMPYLLRCCMDEVYYCSNCGAFLGKTSTLSRRRIC